MARYIEAKYRKIKLLMQFLTLIKKLCEEFDCKNIFGFNGYEIQKKIYSEMAILADGG